MRKLRYIAIAALILSSCGPDFTPQEEIDRLRVLGVQSTVRGTADVAWPGVLDDAVLTALVTDGTLAPPSAFQFAWRLCPLAFGSEADFACAFSEDEFEALLLGLIENFPREQLSEEVPPELVDQVIEQAEDLVDVNFDLGTSTTAVFNLRDVVFSDELDDLPFDPDPILEPVLQALLAGACDQLETQEFPDFVERPECNGTFQVRIDLTVCERGIPCTSDSTPSGEAPPRIVNSVRFLDVVYDSAAVPTPNRNPTVDIMCRTTIPPSATSPGECNINGTVVEADDEPDLFFESDFGFEVADLTEADAELFEEEALVDGTTQTVTTQERLTVSWFVTGGELDRNRSAFDAEQPDNSSIERARTNIWRTPRAADLDPDERDEAYGLLLVVRDGRGGRAFLQRTVRFRGRAPESSN